MEFIRQLVARRQRRSNDLWGEYRDLIRRAVRASPGKDLPKPDADRLAALVEELKLTPEQLAEHADIIRRYDDAKPKAATLPEMEAELAAASETLTNAQQKFREENEAWMTKLRKLQLPIQDLQQKVFARTEDAKAVAMLEGTEWELLGMPDPSLKAAATT